MFIAQAEPATTVHALLSALSSSYNYNNSTIAAHPANALRRQSAIYCSCVSYIYEQSWSLGRKPQCVSFPCAPLRLRGRQKCQVVIVEETLCVALCMHRLLQREVILLDFPTEAASQPTECGLMSAKALFVFCRRHPHLDAHLAFM